MWRHVCFLSFVMGLGGCTASDGVEAAQTGEACANAADAISQCPPGTEGSLEATADSSCSMEGSVDVDSVMGSGSGAVSQVCVGSGSCKVVCTLLERCEFGVTSISPTDGVVCAPPPCGNGRCDAGENPENCAVDCADASCQSGANRCSGDDLELCNEQGLWEQVACGSGQVCRVEENEAACVDSGRICGNDECEDGENATDCPEDCGVRCGDGTCSGGENATDCPEDCGVRCGDGTCSGGENATDCPEDCGTACGDGTCSGGENATDCPQDCGTIACGNGVCDAGENPENCNVDCGAACGNGACEGGEDATTCPQDCDGLECDEVCDDVYRECTGSCVNPNQPAIQQYCLDKCALPENRQAFERFELNQDCEDIQERGILPQPDDNELRCTYCGVSPPMNCAQLADGTFVARNCVNYEWSEVACGEGASCATSEQGVAQCLTMCESECVQVVDNCSVIENEVACTGEGAPFDRCECANLDTMLNNCVSYCQIANSPQQRTKLDQALAGTCRPLQNTVPIRNACGW